MAIRLRVGWSGVRMPVGAIDFPTVSTPPLGEYSASYSVGGVEGEAAGA